MAPASRSCSRWPRRSRRSATRRRARAGRDVDRRDQPRPGIPNAIARPAQLPVHLPRRARRAGDSRITHRHDDGRRARPGRPGARGRRRGGEPRLRERHASPSARSTCCRSPSTPASWCASRARWPRRRSRRALARRPLERRELPGEPHRPPGDRPRDAARHDRSRRGSGAAARLRRRARSETILRACRILVDEGIASPDPARARGRRSARPIERLRLELGGVTIVDPPRSPRLDAYVEEYLRMRAPPRRDAGPGASSGCARRDYFAAHDGAPRRRRHDDRGAARRTTPSRCARCSRSIGPAPGVRRDLEPTTSCCSRGAAATSWPTARVNIDPDAEDLAEIALLTAATVRALGIEPRVAMLSFSNFGGVDHPLRAQGPPGDRDRQGRGRRSWSSTARCSSRRRSTDRCAGELLPVLGARSRTPTCSSSPTSSRATWPCTCCRASGDAVAIGPLLTGHAPARATAAVRGDGRGGRSTWSRSASSRPRPRPRSRAGRTRSRLARPDTGPPDRGGYPSPPYPCVSQTGFVTPATLRVGEPSYRSRTTISFVPCRSQTPGQNSVCCGPTFQ